MCGMGFQAQLPFILYDFGPFRGPIRMSVSYLPSSSSPFPHVSVLTFQRPTPILSIFRDFKSAVYLHYQLYYIG